MDETPKGGTVAVMVRPRLGLPLESTAGTTPESDGRWPFGAWLDTLARIGGDFLHQLEPVALGCAVLLAGCGTAQSVEVEGVVRDGRTGAPISGAVVSAENGTSTETDEDGRFTLSVEEGSGRQLTAEAEGRCPVTETLDVTRAGVDGVTLHLFGRLEVPQDHVQVGFGATVRVEVRLRCETDAPIEWAQTGGPELSAEHFETEDRGRTLVVRTHALEDLVSLEDRVGVIALDRRQRGEYRFRLSATFGEAIEEREVRIVSAPIASGLFQVATGADVYLNGGSGDSQLWNLANRPENSEAELSDSTARTPFFRPDEFGTYVVEHTPTHTQMLLQAGPYENVPRDCGREGCHGEEARGWETTAHAQTFRRGMDGELGADFEERCWSCHATGVDFGIDNGGMHHTAASMGWTQPAPDSAAWDEMPRRVRRHGSVWCSACHGPGRIIPPQFRWQYGSKFQVGVCARCHDVDEGDADANHRSPHVDEWRRSPMSRFSRALAPNDPALRQECAQCHSAQGFVSHQRVGEVAVPDANTVAAITCAACHDSHEPSAPRGLRIYDTSEPIAGSPVEDLGAGALCASCHRPGVARSEALDHAPHAVQGGLLVGRGARTTDATDTGPHRHIADSCVRCHMTRPDPSDPSYLSAGGHTFSVRARTGEPRLSPAACSPCHGEMEPATIGTRDWNRDGSDGPIAREHDDALTIITELLRARIGAVSVSDPCASPHVAVDVIDHDAILQLVDAEGVMLGDCNANAVFDDGETRMTASALPADLRESAYDVVMLRSDGSHGVHNPDYAFSILGALNARLE